MAGKRLHDWNLPAGEAVQVQDRLRKQLNLSWDGRLITRIAGVDVSIKAESVHCAIVVLAFPELTLLKAVTARAPLTFPYIPGLLSFREGPAVLAAWDKLEQKPELLMFDGQGIAHPRGVGIASQMGLWLERPTIGVAKSRLYGRHAEPGPKRGDRAELYGKDSSVIGAVLRTKDNVKPLYISPGHLVDVEHAVEFVLACHGGYRLPETTRWAHRVAGGETFSTSKAQ